eukprot:gene25796-11469_t
MSADRLIHGLPSAATKGPISLVAFKIQVGGDILIDPHDLTPVRELSESETWTVEEARRRIPEQRRERASCENRWRPSMHEERVVVKSFRPNWINTAEELKKLIYETRRLKELQHE